MKKNILIIDDHENQRGILRCVLEAVDCHVVEAASGKEALIKANDEQFDFVILDYHMPDMTGIEVFEAMNDTIDSREAPKVIVVTSSQSKAVMNAFRSLGCRTVLTKPLEARELIEAISDN